MNTIIMGKTGLAPGKHEIRVVVATSPKAPGVIADCSMPVYAPKTRPIEFRVFIPDSDVVFCPGPEALVAGIKSKIRSYFRDESVEIAEVRQVGDTGCPGTLYVGMAYFTCEVPAIDQAISQWEREAEEGRKAVADLQVLKEFGRETLRERNAAVAGHKEALAVVDVLRSRWYGRLALWLIHRKGESR